MHSKTATCRCGQLRAEVVGDPIRVSLCHCLDCKRRSGSAFTAQARWPDAQVAIAGRFKSWSHVGESGHKTTYRFCSECGSTLVYASAGMPGITAVAMGGFADPSFEQPKFSVYEERKHDWVEITGDSIEHLQ